MTRRRRKTERRRLLRLPRLLAAGSLLLSLALGYSLTASNTMSASNAGSSAFGITPNTLKPSECAGVNLTSLVTGSGGNVQGTVGGTLIIGSANSETLKSSVGDNCVIGGAGTDTVDVRITGGTEICIISSATNANGPRGCTSITVRP